MQTPGGNRAMLRNLTMHQQVYASSGSGQHLPGLTRSIAPVGKGADHHASWTQRPISIPELAVDFGARVLASERRFVAAMWLDPVAGHDAAFDRGFSGDRFADPTLGFIYSYVASCASRGTGTSLVECIGAGRTCQLPIWIDLDELYFLITDSDARAGKIDHCAREVARYMDHRERASECIMRELGQLMIDTSEFEFTVRRRRASAPPRLHGRVVA